MEFLSEYGLFLAKAITIVVAIIVVIGAMVSAGQKNKAPHHQGHIIVTNISEDLKELEDDIRKETFSKEEFKAYQKEQKQFEKDRQKKMKAASKIKDDDSSEEEDIKRLFVVDFEGDVEASAVENLREEITAILSVAKKTDEVLLKLESPGGMVHTYGLASSQLQRIRKKGLKLNIAVDEVAASGGYMMACVGDHIMAAPFSIIGSIGVLGQIPNFSRLLKHNKIDYEQHTAGEFKRTLTMFGENTDKARDKFREDLQITHDLFKAFIHSNRESLDVDKVATGEHWYGSQALELGLVDEITTSDDFIVSWAKDNPVYKVKYEIKKSLSDRLPVSIQKGIQNILLNLWHKSESNRLFK